MRKGRLLGALFKSRPRSLSTDCLAPRSRGSWPGEDLAGDYSPSIAGQKIPMQGFYSALQRTFSTARLHAYHDGEPDPSTLDVTARYTHNMEVAMRLSPGARARGGAAKQHAQRLFGEVRNRRLLADALRPVRRGIVGRRIRGMPHQGTALLRARENLNCRTDAPHQRFCGKLAFEDIGQHERTGVGAAGGPSHEPRQL